MYAKKCQKMLLLKKTSGLKIVKNHSDLFNFYFLTRVLPRGLNNLVAIDTVAAIFSIT